MVEVNVNRVKRCAFCINWYDPTNSAITPKAPSIGVWQYDMKATNMCTCKNIEMKASGVCNKFECKL